MNYDFEVKLSCDLDPIVSYKGRYNRDTYKKLVKYGKLFLIIDCNHPVFDVELRTLQEGDIIQSYNDSMLYVVTKALKTEEGLTRWIDYQPLFHEHNFVLGLLKCILLDGYENPFLKVD